jgi:hypothetical protein
MTALRNAIAGLPAAGGAIYIPAGMTCDLGGNTVNINTGSPSTGACATAGGCPVTIFGDGPTSIVKGSGNPVLSTNTTEAHSVQLSNFKLQTTSTNNGLDFIKNSLGLRVFVVDHVEFENTGCGGTLLYQQGGAFGSVTSNWFHTTGCSRNANGTWNHSAIGYHMHADSSIYTQNVQIAYNTLEYLDVAMKTTASYLPGNAGQSIIGNHFWDNNYAANFQSGDDLGFLNNNVDGNGLGGVYFEDYTGARVKDNFITSGSWAGVAAGPAIYVKNTSLTSAMADYEIVGNHIIRWNDVSGSGGHGIELYGSGGNIQVSRIDGNKIYGNTNAGNCIYFHAANGHSVSWNTLYGNNCTFWGGDAIKLTSDTFWNDIDNTTFGGTIGGALFNDPNAYTYNRHGSYRAVNNKWNSGYGQYTTTAGAGSPTTFSFPHGLVATPVSVSVTAASQCASYSGSSCTTANPFWVTVDSTNITVRYRNGASNGSSMSWFWTAVCN